MILYILFFCICFLIEHIKGRKNKFYIFLVVSLFGFLCFGYMTGSDWRGYEELYLTQSFLRIESTGEIGFIYAAQFFSRFIPDFWLFNGLMKCLYLATLIRFLMYFTTKPYVSIALGFANSLLFMLIDCPMRFMMAMTLVLFSIILLLKKRSKFHIVISIVFLLLSVTLHTAMVIMVGFVLLAFFAPLFSKLHPVYVFLFFIGTILLASFSGIFDFLFDNFIPMLGEERFDAYTHKEQSTLMTVNTIKYVVLLLILLANKKSILSCKYGEYIYFYACLYFVFFPITYSIPTMFRLNIFFGYFADISFAYLLFEGNRAKTRRQFENTIIIAMTLFMLCRNCYNDYKLTPYSNSIPYIIKGDHLPYSYRDSYNPNHHDAEFWF